MKLSTLSVALLTSVISFSAGADLTQQRATYQKIGELLSISQSEPTRNLARILLAQIKDYPLYPYAQYQLLNSDKDNLSLSDIEAYQQANPTLPFANRLKKNGFVRCRKNKTGKRFWPTAPSCRWIWGLNVFWYRQKPIRYRTVKIKQTKKRVKNRPHLPLNCLRKISPYCG